MEQIERRDKHLVYISDEAVMEQQMPARRITQRLNTMDRSDFEGIREVVKELFAKSENAFVNPPFYCDYGYNIEVGDNCLINYNCTFIDVAKIKLGNFCLLGPNVSIYTAGHPIHPAPRNGNYTYGVGVELGDNVWVGGNTVICPGVKIGSNSVIGAGSVATKDIPAWTVAAGNPCRVIREITEDDRHFYFKDRPLENKIEEEINERIREACDPRRFPVKEEQS